ncbi:hypothetical protein [Kutzneria sp. NPDC052558]|uniref:hypothetical protein n=1 Tax=Kutzneria sp. NPDC052558 TaxID=3364121 RepID=UPI0037C82697
MRTWMRRGIPAALLAGGVLAMSAGNAAAVPAPIGDPTGLADTALRLTDIVGHKGLPPLPDASQIQLPTAPIGQSQRDLEPGLAGGGLSLSNVQLNGQDLPKPQLPGLPALPALPGLGGGERSLDPTHIAISDLPQLQQLPKLPSVGSGLPVTVLPTMSTSRALPNLTYSGVVPTAGLHDLTTVPDLSSLPLIGGATGERDLPGLSLLGSLPGLGGQQRDLPGLSLLGSLPGLGGQRALPAVPGLEVVQGLLATTPLTALLASTPLGSVAGRDLPAIPALPLHLPALPLHLPALPGASSERDLPGLSLLGSLPGLGGQRALPAVPGLEVVQGLLASTPLTALLASTPLGSVAGRDLPAIPALPLHLPALPGLGGQQRDLPGLSLLGALPGLGSLPGLGALDEPADAQTIGDDTDARSLPGIPALPKLPGLGGLPVGARSLPIPALPALPLPGLNALPLGVPADADATDADATTDSDLTPDTDARELPVVDSVLPKLPLAVPAVPGASLSGFHGIPALGPSFTTTLPANDSARSIVPGVPSTSGLLGGLLGHAPRLPVTGV